MAIQWNEENAAHLYRRAAFGGTPLEINQSVRDGLELTVERLLSYQSQPNDALESRLARLNLDLRSGGKLKNLARWWLVRMIFTARPLEERMTLLWHDHFATAWAKVLHLGWLKGENEKTRAYAIGDFRALVIVLAQDAAMQYWLDQFLSTRTNLNENFGREVLELFTLGVGNYTEADVLASARAFTGWSHDGTTAEFRFNAEGHDFGDKTFLGETGPWNGDDIVRIACRQPAHGRLIASKLFSYFAYENPEPEVVERFARIYLESGNNIAVLVRAILTSEEMYSLKAIWGKVKSPIDHVVIASRQLLLAEDVDESFLHLLQGGQTPFNPPDVAGWDGGLTWITPAAVLNRMNFADALARQFDPIPFTRGDVFRTAEELVDLYLRRLGPLRVSPQTRASLVRYVSPNGSLPEGGALMAKQRGLARLILSLPEWQMY